MKLSSCCNAEVREADHVCTKCLKPCDVYDSQLDKPEWLTKEVAEGLFRIGGHLRLYALNFYLRSELYILPTSYQQAFDMGYLFAIEVESEHRRYTSLRKLEILRDIYRQGWKPDWDDTIEDSDRFKYAIFYKSNEIKIDATYHNNHFLVFNSFEIANKFYDNFRILIEEAKTLLGGE